MKRAIFNNITYSSKSGGILLAALHALTPNQTLFY